MLFLTLITRCRNEPFLSEFVEYYLSQGVDMIHVIDDQSSIDYSELQKHPKVTFHKAKLFTNYKTQLADVNQLYNQIRNTSEWFIYVDCDEYINTRKNPKKTIRDELKSTFKNVDAIKVPWIMMASNGREKDPKRLLVENVYRWNHDKKHPHKNNWRKGRCRYDQIEVKCIFKGSKFNKVSVHCPTSTQSYICVNSVNAEVEDLNSFYKNLREKDINSAYMICHHYRIVSLESCLRKIKDTKINAYKTKLVNLLLSDHSEIIDESLKTKVISEPSHTTT